MTGASTSPNASRCPRSGSTSEPDALPPVVVVHSLAHVLAALDAAAAADREVVLLSASEAGIYAGAGWFRALVEAGREAVPQARFTIWVDCGGDAGAALAALRAGIAALIFTGAGDVARRLADIAAKQGAVLASARPPVDLDLGEAFFASADVLRRQCADILARPRPIC